MISVFKFFSIFIRYTFLIEQRKTTQ